jgi:hypothetical protein
VVIVAPSDALPPVEAIEEHLRAGRASPEGWRSFRRPIELAGPEDRR